MAATIAVMLGLLVGLSLGALGGGGSTLAVPILVFVAGMQAQDATTASLLVVGIASAIGVFGHLRNGNVRLGAGVAFGLAVIVGSRVGTLLNRSLDENMLLFAFSGLILFVAVRMYRSVAHRRHVAAGAGADISTESSMSESLDNAPATSPGGASAAVSSAVLVTTPATQGKAIDLSPRSLARLAAAATAVGVLTGLFGVGGGFAVVPALTLLLGFEAKEAIGTSLVVIAINAAMALSMRWGHLDFDWGLVVPFLATVTVGVLAGSVVARRVAADRLTQGFAVMLGCVALYTAASTMLV